MTVEQGRIGIDGRIFHVAQPGGDASVSLKHGRYIHDNFSDTILYGHESISNSLGEAHVVSDGLISRNMVYGLLWEQTILPILGMRSNIDLLYSPSSYCPIAPTAFKCVVAIQDIPSFHGFGSKRYRTFRKSVLPVITKKADHIITVSKFTKKDISKHLNIDKSKISVVYNGIDAIYFEGESKPPNIELPEQYLLYVGAKSERKNVDGVLSAYELLVSEYDIPHKLVVVGPKQNDTYDLMDIQKENVLLPDYLSPNELKYVYENASVFVYPSFHESFGLPPVEAAACGTPVVTTRRGAIPEVMGSNAEFVDPECTDSIANGIMNVLSDHRCAQELVAGGRARANNFQWDKQVVSLIEVLRTLSSS